MSIELLKSLTAHIYLRVGDVIIDSVTGHVGTLFNRKRHISIEYDDVYVWTVKWFDVGDPILRPAEYIEEEGMKLSVVAGTYAWHSVENHQY
jgi:hypothetical protein